MIEFVQNGCKREGKDRPREGVDCRVVEYNRKHGIVAAPHYTFVPDENGGHYEADEEPKPHDIKDKEELIKAIDPKKGGWQDKVKQRRRAVVEWDKNRKETEK